MSSPQDMTIAEFSIDGQVIRGYEHVTLQKEDVVISTSVPQRSQSRDRVLEYVDRWHLKLDTICANNKGSRIQSANYFSQNVMGVYSVQSVYFFPRAAVHNQVEVSEGKARIKTVITTAIEAHDAMAHQSDVLEQYKSLYAVAANPSTTSLTVRVEELKRLAIKS